MKFQIVLAAIAFICSEALGAIGVYVPQDAVTNDGNSSFAGPFSSASRFQQVYGPGALPTLGPDSAYMIHLVAFRADETATPISGSANLILEVRLSTTSRGPDGLSTTFTENVGPDEITVFGPAPLSLNWSRYQFFTAITFNQPFLYNPSAGNLLLDVRNYTPSGFVPLDAFALLGDSVSTVSNGLGVDRPTGGLATHGLATFLSVDIVPIPEPSASALLLLSLLAIGWKLSRSRCAPIPKG